MRHIVYDGLSGFTNHRLTRIGRITYSGMLAVWFSVTLFSIDGEEQNRDQFTVVKDSIGKRG